MKRNIIHNRHQTLPELYKPCSVNKMHNVRHSDKLNTPELFLSNTFYDLRMKMIFLKFPVHGARIQIRSVFPGVVARCDFLHKFCFDTDWAMFAMNPEPRRCCNSAGGFSFLCDIRNSFLKISRHTEV